MIVFQAFPEFIFFCLNTFIFNVKGISKQWINKWNVEVNHHLYLTSLSCMTCYGNCHFHMFNSCYIPCTCISNQVELYLFNILPLNCLIKMCFISFGRSSGQCPVLYLWDRAQELGPGGWALGRTRPLGPWVFLRQGQKGSGFHQPRTSRCTATANGRVGIPISLFYSWIVLSKVFISSGFWHGVYRYI